MFEDLTKNGMVFRGDDERLITQVMPLGIPAIDRMIGGGLPIGKCTLIVGAESTGKTILCQYAAAANQQRKDHQDVIYVDLEHSYDQDWWEQSGVDPEHLWVVRPDTAENAIDFIAAVIGSENVGLVIADSIAVLPPAAIIEEGAEHRTIGQLARLVNMMFVKVTPQLVEGKAMFLVTNQLRDNIGSIGYSYPGGYAQRYNSHLWLRTKRVGWINEGNQRVGFNMEVQVLKNKTAPPQPDVQVPFRFTSQMDLALSLIGEAIDAGLITQSGPYYTVNDHKVLGKQNLRDYLSQQPELVDEIRGKLYGS